MPVRDQQKKLGITILLGVGAAYMIIKWFNKPRMTSMRPGAVEEIMTARVAVTIYVKPRCDVAAEIYNKAKESGVKPPTIIALSAGTAHSPQTMNAAGRPVWEAASTAAYLVKNLKIDPKAILMETTSYDTIGNAYFLRTQLSDILGFKKMWIVTSKFHMPRSRAIFEWIFSASGGASEGYQLGYIATEDLGRSEEEIKVREEREARSLKNVQKLAVKFPTLKQVALFLLKDHRMYSVEGLFQEDEKVSEALKKTYSSG
ncbi:hypothetical protein AAMO2058_001522400 [Amorphochlora amoebiformis]